MKLMSLLKDVSKKTNFYFVNLLFKHSMVNSKIFVNSLVVIKTLMVIKNFKIMFIVRNYIFILLND